MIPSYKITISPLCSDEVVNYFDAIATVMRLYDKAKVFLDLRDGPLHFIPMNTAYAVVLNEKTGDLHTDFYSAALMLTQLHEIHQIERVFVTQDAVEICEQMRCSGVTFEVLENLSLNKGFSVDALSYFDCDFLLKIISAERNALPIKVPNLKIHYIDLTQNGEILVDGDIVKLENIEERIKEIEKESLQKNTEEKKHLGELLDFFGSAITDDYYCYCNPNATLNEYSEYKVRLVKWFLQLKYSDLANYAGNNCFVEKLLACVNIDSIILPSDYFSYWPFKCD